MTFGKRVKKSSSEKVKKNKSKYDKDRRNELARENLILDRIIGIVECTDAGCCNVEYIRNKMSGVKEVETYIKKCAKRNDFIFHRGWLYNRLWSIEDINEISNDTVVINDFEGDNVRIDNDLLVKLTALYEKENEPVKVTWFEMLISRGVLYITEKQLYNSLERLMRAGKIYEPRIGEFAPTYDSM